ncbi:MAG: ATP-binding protein [Desulfuromonadaceae bacterium]|nr:ATP-binding protein [Desulfuromonadaceae bacterium]MDD2847300.1 ATP-binding protein [Desulfuromonadaceae bacterium]MDD4130244.1 ATP-binding protein [Desulfuromonadaceae bacterium]
MKTQDSLPHTETDNRLSELTLLYQLSNTMLSTIRLNKLAHLILTAVTTPSSNLFERAILFLRNEKTNVLQGMLAVTRQSSEGLRIVGGHDALGSRWDISDEIISLQRSDDFCLKVRLTRIEIDRGCPLVYQVISERALCQSDEVQCQRCQACSFIRPLCGGSFAAAPLVARETAIGMIVVDNPDSGRQISSNNLHFLQLFANQAGMAIENSMLYNRLEEAHLNLSEARERLSHGERLAAIGEMAASLAHELKNPLITIGGFAGRLLKSLPVDAREHRYADTIVSEVGRLEKMLSEILNFSRKPTICFSNCNLEDIVRECLASCTTAFEDHNIKVSFSSDDQPLIVSGDAHQLKQVFLNLVLNSCDAMPEGGKLILTLERTHLDRKSVIVTIEDTGGGIPKEMQSQIFNPFFTTKHHGTGLGLSIANRIIINHFGSIETHNTEQGAVFTIILPLLE